MSTTAQRFEKFLSNIQLSKLQIEDGIRKHTGVRRTLHNSYYLTSFIKSISNTQEEEFILEATKSYQAHNVLFDDSVQYRTSLLVGSYGKNTAIAPPSDIDVLFEMPPNLFNDYDSKPYNGQSKLLQDVKKVLLSRYPNTDIRADGQIISVPFSSYNIEVLPAFRRTDGSYYYPDTNGGGKWKHTNPRAEKEYIRQSNKRSNGNTVKLIKMLKAWKKYCNVNIKSLLLELCVIGFLSEWEHYNKSTVYFDWMTRDFFYYAVSRIDYYFYIPGIDESIKLDTSYKTKFETALARAEKACEYETSNDVLAWMEWQKIFGDRYPLLV